MKRTKLDCTNEALTSGSLWKMVRRAQVVTFIGAGGKTTCLNRLTREITQAGEPVIATTTTKVYPLTFPSLCKNAGEFPFLEIITPCFWYADSEKESGKWLGLPTEIVDQAIHKDSKLKVKGHFWLIEGDGARECQLKCWAAHEPQIPRLTESAVLVIDGRLWGKTLQENEIYRSELCPDLIGHIWSPKLAWEYILRSPVFKPEYREMSWVVLFNEWSGPKNGSRQDPFDGEVYALLKVGEEYLRQEQLPESLLAKHLRLASGDAKEGSLQWFDLW
ncbi:selenium cofactor biosynthesis protein YqeC [Desulfitobacterium sp.]|uniref:selenium cofactor biosynthesis protein YqeC n=1 Tax=Desulfitobacterium sp. TaxID=49981 RepID=UPI002BA087D0|nr:selenium cofactor biosynthesis protein YqeC [Desulfitobacterium sp.]HVJ49641.1 selenium cofactor biosynthesis protein YqeC [Desulfitobacterium sp.]